MITSLDQLDPTKKYTYADYLTWQFQERVELIFGKISRMSLAPKTYHQTLSKELLYRIRKHLEGKKCKVFTAPFDVCLPIEADIPEYKTENIVQPDICVVCDLKKLDERGCHGAPDLIIEIVSKSSVKKDLHEKYDLYEQAGVKEYWVVHPNDISMSVYLLNSSRKYEFQKPYTLGDTLHCTVLPGLDINVEETYGDIVNEPEVPYGTNAKRV